MTEDERKIAVILAQAQMDKDAAQGGGIPSGINPQMTRPVKSSFMNPADYADEPKSSMRQMIDDARSGKRDDIPALLMAGIENVGTMPLKMMTLEGMHGLTQDIARAIATPYNVLTSPEPVTTEQMIEPAANIALTAPLGGLAAGRMAPVELSQGKEEARGLLGLLQQSDPYGRDYLSPVGQGDMPDVIATDPRLYPTPAPAPDRNASMLERYMPQSMIEWGSSVKAAQGKPTLFGKMLGAVGLDESGRRGQTSWSDAAKSTMYLPGELVEGLIGSGRNLANYEGGAYHTSPEAADRARASQLTGDVFNVAGALPMGAAGMSAAGRMAPVERVAYSNSKEGALPGLLSGAGQKQGTSATAGHPSGSGVPSLPPSDPMAGGLPGHTPSSGQPGQGGHTSLPRDPSLDAWRNSVIQDIAKRIEDADLRLDDIGLRAETGRTFKEGEYLPKSRVWDDGAPLNEELNGTSTIGLDRYTTTPEDVAGALHGLGNYEGDSLVLVGGRGKEFGVDSGEHVIRNAQSLGQWPRYKDGMQLFSNSKEASLPGLLSQGGDKGLPMDTASRMQRARDMGFDTSRELYHGTNATFDEFKPSDRGALGPGAYLTKQPGIASRYGENVGAYHVRGNILDTGPWRDIPDGLTDRIKAELTPTEAARWERLWPQPRELEDGRIIGKNPDAETLREVLTRSVERERVPEILRKMGYDGIEGIADGHELSMFDPKNIRRTDAAFDPAKRDSANLLASNPEEAAPLAGIQAHDDGTPMILRLARLLAQK